MLNLWPVANKPKAMQICRAFADGAPKGAKGHVFYGVNESNHEAWQKAAEKGQDWYYIDNSYFDCVRGEQYRVTKNRVQVNPLGRETDGKRFAALELTIAPWKPIGPRLLAVEQSPSFMRWVAHDMFWLDRTVQALPGREVHLRHWSANKIKQASTLRDELRSVDFVVTHSSAAAIEAVLCGVSAIVSAMSALSHMVCGMGAMAHLDERLQTFGVLADNQFSIDEIRKGEAWQWLNK